MMFNSTSDIDDVISLLKIRKEQEMHIEKLKKKIEELEARKEGIEDFLMEYEPRSDYSKMVLNDYKVALKDVKNELAELKEELMYALNDMSVGDVSDLGSETTDTITPPHNDEDEMFDSEETEVDLGEDTHTLNACDHQFVDVYDVIETIPDSVTKVASDCDCYSYACQMLRDGKTSTKKYILSYCKVCGYTIRPTH